MNELDWPRDERLILMIRKRLATAIATFEALAPPDREWAANTWAMRESLDLADAISDAMESGATPDQMVEHFERLSSFLPRAAEAWKKNRYLHDDPEAEDREEEQIRRTRTDFHTLRARLYPDGNPNQQ